MKEKTIKWTYTLSYPHYPQKICKKGGVSKRKIGTNVLLSYNKSYLFEKKITKSIDFLIV